jgi:DNA glycosylase AlkZ-like
VAVIEVAGERVVAHRLARHHLAQRAPLRKLQSVAGEMGGAQAQVLSAGKVSLWARVSGVTVADLDRALWKDRTLVRAWGMRRTMFLLPAFELGVFLRGTAKRSEYAYRYAAARTASLNRLDRLLDDVAAMLEEPMSRNEIAAGLKARGHRLKHREGGGWGDERLVPHVEMGGQWLSIGFILHMMGSKAPVCTGPNAGNESTYVRADRWVRDWKDVPQEVAEEKLLAKYLMAYGPATIADFALWMGVYVRDAKPIWARMSPLIEEVGAAGVRAWILRSDLRGLKGAEVRLPSVRLLPFFDSFLLGHKSHRNVVDEASHRQVYRAQGWVSPVLLVDGRAQGVWSYEQARDTLNVSVRPFALLSRRVASLVEEEAESLGRFLGAARVQTRYP